MSQEPETREGLQLLFDRCRDDPDAVSMQRMLARAREIPEQAQTKLGFRRFSAFGLLVLSGLVGTQVIRETLAKSPSGLPASTPPSTIAARALDPGRIESTVELAAPLSRALENDLAFADSFDANVFDDLALDPGDLADQDLEAWIVAASESLSDG